MGISQSISEHHIGVLSLIDQEAQFFKDHEHLPREQILAMAQEEGEDFVDVYEYSRAGLARRFLEHAERMRGVSSTTAQDDHATEEASMFNVVIPGRVKIMNNGAIPIEVGDWVYAFAPSPNDRFVYNRVRSNNDGYDDFCERLYAEARTSERFERKLLQDEPIICQGKTHASTKYKQSMRVTQRHRIVHTRSNTQKRQLYGALIKGKK